MDLPRAARVTAFAQLSQELQSVLAALGAAALEIGQPGVELAWSNPPFAAFRGPLHGGVAPHCCRCQRDRARDRHDRLAGRAAALHLCMTHGPPTLCLLRGSLICAAARESVVAGVIRNGSRRAGGDGKGAQAGMSADQPAFQHLARVQKEVPAIRDLLGTRDDGLGRTRVACRPIPCDDLQIGVRR